MVSPRSIRRIAVALDASSHSVAALESAAALAARWHAELLGLFVEDIDLVRLAGLPVAREVLYGSNGHRPMNSAVVEQSLRSQAVRLRQLTESAARAHNIRWSFETARGRVGAELLARAAHVDLLVLGRVGRTPRVGRRVLGSTAREALVRATCAVMLIDHGRRMDEPVAVFFDGSPGAQRAVRLAAQLAGQGGNGLVVLIAVENEQQRDSMQAQVRDALEGLPVEPRWQYLSDSGIEPLLEGVAETGAHLLVVGADEGSAEEKQRLSQLAATDLALVVVR